MGLLDDWKLRVPLHGGNLPAGGEDISVLHMKNEIQTGPKLEMFLAILSFFSFSFHVFS